MALELRSVYIYLNHCGQNGNNRWVVGGGGGGGGEGGGVSKLVRLIIILEPTIHFSIVAVFH